MSEDKWYLVTKDPIEPNAPAYRTHVHLTQHPEQFPDYHVIGISPEVAADLRRGVTDGLTSGDGQ